MPYGELVFTRVKEKRFEESNGRVWLESTYESNSSPKIIVRYGGWEDESEWQWRTVVNTGLWGVNVNLRRTPCLMQ